MHEASNQPPGHRSAPVALVETSDPYAAVVECIPLLDAGYDVVVCGGSRTDELCPVLDGLPCPLVREADLVINAVKDPSTQAAVVAGIRRTAPGVSVVVVTDVGRAARHVRKSATRRCAREHEPVVSVFP